MAPDYHKYNQYPFVKTAGLTGSQIYRIQHSYSTFYVGNNRKPFFIHPGFLGAFPESISRSVRVLEGKPNEFVASLEDVDEFTFGRCCQFVYTGDYSVPKPGFTMASSDRDKMTPEPDIPQDLEDIRNNRFHPAQLLNVPNMLQKYVDDADLAYKPRPNMTPEEDYSEIFLCHARLYRFALQSEWTSLCIITYTRLLLILGKFTLFQERIADIVRLLHFVFQKCHRQSDALHHLLLDYIVWNMPFLEKDAGFLEFWNASD